MCRTAIDGSPAFRTLVDEFRRLILEEAVASGLPGLVFTFAWDLENPESRGQTPFRLERKRSKRDPDFSRQNMTQLESRWVMNTGSTPTPGEDFLRERGWLRIDSTSLTAAEVARRIADELS